jgi:hypothetical protein
MKKTKLVLNREQIRILSTKVLEQVAGGRERLNICWPNTWTCPPMTHRNCG